MARASTVDDSAAGDTATRIDDGTAVDVDEMVARYNENVDDIDEIVTRVFDDQPLLRDTVLALVEPAKDLVANERLAARIHTSDGETVTYYLETNEDAEIVEHHRGVDGETPSVVVPTDEATLRRIQNSDRPHDATVEAYESGGIELRGSDFTGGVLTTLLDIVVAIGDWLIDG